MSHTSAHRAWLVCLSAASFFCFEYFQLNMFNALDPELIRTFNTDATTLSWLSSAYFYGNVLLLIPAGLLLDRVSTRSLIIGAMSLSLVGTLLFALSSSLSMAIAGRFLVGVSGGPFCFLSSVRLAARWFVEQRLAFVIGMIVAIGMIGGLLAQTPFTLLVESLGWRQALMVNVLVGVVLLLNIWWNVKDYPPGFEKEYHRQRAEYKALGFVQGFKIVSRKAQNWLCGSFASLLNLPIFLLGALWGSLYLTQIHGLSRMEASMVTSMLYIGMLLGAPGWGLISDHLQRRKSPMLIGTMICLSTLIWVMYAEHLSLMMLILLFLLMGFTSAVQCLAYPMVAESNPRSLTGSAEGLSAALIMSGGAVFQPIFGWMMDRRWSGQMDGHIPLYGIESYHPAMLVMPIACVVCLACIYGMRETFAKPLAGHSTLTSEFATEWLEEETHPAT